MRHYTTSFWFVFAIVGWMAACGMTVHDLTMVHHGRMTIGGGR